MFSVEPVKIELRQCDALTIGADLTFMGTGEALLRRVEESSGKKFTKVQYPEDVLQKYGDLGKLKKGQIVSSDEYVWRNVIAISMRPGRAPRTSFLEEYFEILRYSVRRSIRPKAVLFVPFQNRPKETSAMLVLLCAWTLCRLSVPGLRILRGPQPKVVIVDHSEVAVFREFLGPRMQDLQFFAERQLSRFWRGRDSVEIPKPLWELSAGES